MEKFKTETQLEMIRNNGDSLLSLTLKIDKYKNVFL